MNPTILFLDFDGVVADSMPAKTQAFAAAFEGHGFDVNAIIGLYRRYAGSGRDRIFDRVFESLAGRPMIKAERDRARTIFERLEATASPGLALFAGVADFLTRQADKRALVLVTGTPPTTIDTLLNALGVASYFSAVYSASRAHPKETWIAEELDVMRIARTKALFVGDSLVDMTAAESAGVPFVGVGNPDFFVSGNPVAVIDMLPDLDRMLDD